MKTSFLLIACILLLTMASCAKKYSCKCTVSITAQYYYPHETETVVPIDKRTTKKKAQQICDNTSAQLRANTKEIIKGWEIGSTCVLKDY